MPRYGCYGYDWTNAVWGRGVVKAQFLFHLHFKFTRHLFNPLVMFLLTFSFPSPDSPQCISSCLNDPLPPRLTLSVLPSLLAVSRTRMTTLRCGLRYPGLSSWPGSVHRSTAAVGCTEPLCPFCAVSPPRLACRRFCLHAHYRTHTRLTFALT